MSAKISFRVVYCSSRDDNHPETELEAQTRSTKGWQSGKFCDYPQELILQFDHVYDVGEIQLLSHQHNIATTIEIFVGEGKSGLYISDFEEVRFNRLGYLSFHSNSRSNFKSRELKTIYIQTRGCYIKLRLHQNHVNTKNLFSQVGLVAINVLGSRVANVPSKSIESPNAFEDDIDDITASQIQNLQKQKVEAVDREDYDLAKNIKSQIDILRQNGAQLAQLERQKRMAVDNEDYDSAKLLKNEIERMRSMFSNRPPPDFYYPSQGFQGQGPPQGFQGQGPPQGFQGQGPPQGFQGQGPPQGFQGQGGPSFPQMPPFQKNPMFQQTPQLPPPSTLPPQFPFTPQQLKQASPSFPGLSGAYNIDEESAPGDLHAGSLDKPVVHELRRSQDDFQLAPKPKTLFEPLDKNEKSPPKKIEPEILEVLDVDVKKDSEPDPLSSSDETEAENWIPVFGLRNIACLYSKNWALREEGVNKIGEMIEYEDDAISKKSPKAALELVSQLLKRFISDHVAQVFSALLKLLDITIENLGKKVDSNVLGKIFQPVIEILMTRAAGKNVRMSNDAKTQLISLINSSPLDPSTFCATILNKLPTSPKPLLTRLQLLVELIKKFGFAEKFLPYNKVMDLIVPMFQHKNGEVRDAAIILATLLYSKIGKKVIPTLKQQKPALIQALNESIEKATGEKDVIPKPITTSGTSAIPKIKKKEKEEKHERIEEKEVKSSPSKEVESSPQEPVVSQQQQYYDPETYKQYLAYYQQQQLLIQQQQYQYQQEQYRMYLLQQQMQMQQPVQHSMNQAEMQQLLMQQSMHQPEIQPGMDPSMQQIPPDEYPIDGADAYPDDFNYLQCQFCGIEDESFAEETEVDMHYWKSCPMLIPCQFCEQIIEIASLNQHWLADCSSPHKECPICLLAIPANEFDAHSNGYCQPAKPLEQANKCPLCKMDISPGPEGWRMHILEPPQCPNNPRTAK